MLNRHGRMLLGLLIIILVLLVIWLIPWPGESKPDQLKPFLDGDFDHERYTQPEIAAAVEWMIEKVYQHPWWQDDELRSELSYAFYAAGNQYDFPQLLLTGMGYRESVFDPSVVGRDGELGVMQVGPYCRTERRCKRACGDMSTLKMQVDCGACCLRLSTRRCKSLMGGVTAYLCGKCSSTHPKVKNPSRVNWAMRVRFKLWKITHELVRGKSSPNVFSQRGFKHSPGRGY